MTLQNMSALVKFALSLFSIVFLVGCPNINSLDDATDNEKIIVEQHVDIVENEEKDEIILDSEPEPELPSINDEFEQRLAALIRRLENCEYSCPCD